MIMESNVDIVCIIACWVYEHGIPLDLASKSTVSLGPSSPSASIFLHYPSRPSVISPRITIKNFGQLASVKHITDTQPIYLIFDGVPSDVLMSDKVKGYN